MIVGARNSHKGRTDPPGSGQADKANFSGEMAAELKALIESNTVRVRDLVVLIKDEDGSVEASELREADDSQVGELRAPVRDLAVLLAEEDVAEIGESLEPGSGAAVLVWENSWGAVRLGRAPVGRATGDEWPDPHPGAHRGGRGGSRGRPDRSMTWGCSEIEEIAPA